MAILISHVALAVYCSKTDGSLDMHVSNRRKKLSSHPLRTIRGMGFVIDGEGRR
jgi:DNA-binding response OmpR family regulator